MTSNDQRSITQFIYNFSNPFRYPGKRGKAPHIAVYQKILPATWQPTSRLSCAPSSLMQDTTQLCETS